jgi:hypothetical protein
MSAPFAGGFNNSCLSASKQALRSVTFSIALHFSKLGLRINQTAAIRDAMHNPINAALIPNRSVKASSNLGDGPLPASSSVVLSKSHFEACMAMTRRL